MKILFLIPSLAGGGQEKAGMILTNYLSGFHEVQVVSLEPASAYDYPYKSRLSRIEIKRANTTAGKILVVFKRILALRKIKKQFKPDVSIAIGPTAMLINSLSFGKEQKISSLRQSLLQLKDNRFLNKILFRISGKLVPVHNGINKELYDLYKIKNNLFAYNGYDLEKIAADCSMPVEKELLPFFEANVLCHMGRFDSQKCQWQLAKVFHLARKVTPGLKLLMIGDVDYSNPLNSSVYQFCVNYLQNNGYRVKPIGTDLNAPANEYDVMFLGQQMNPHRYMAKSSVFVFPSAWEGFPNALVEALACGLPVVSADCPTGPKEILEDVNTAEQFGILLPLFSHVFIKEALTTNGLHQQWADTITGLLSDNYKMKYLKSQAFKRAKEFSVEKSCKKWLDIIDQKIK